MRTGWMLAVAVVTLASGCAAGNSDDEPVLLQASDGAKSDGIVSLRMAITDRARTVQFICDEWLSCDGKIAVSLDVRSPDSRAGIEEVASRNPPIMSATDVLHVTLIPGIQAGSDGVTGNVVGSSDVKLLRKSEDSYGTSSAEVAFRDQPKDQLFNVVLAPENTGGQSLEYLISVYWQ